MMEIELKLASTNEALSQFKELVLPQLTQATTSRELKLVNHYFDTPDQALGKRRMGCRVRIEGKHIEQTIKTQGQVVGGLHQRPEYNVAIEQEQPNLRLFPADIWANDFALDEINQALELQFTTNFTRSEFLFQHGDAKVELVFDQGEVRLEKESLPINEIELELKQGNPSALFDLADLIADAMPVRISNVTKAARGYQLINKALPKTHKLPDFLPLNGDESTEAGLCKAIEFALSHWQHHEQVYQQSQHLKALNEIAFSIELLLQSVSLYLPVLQCPELLNLHKQLLVLTQQWQWQEDLTCIRQLRARQGPFSRKVPKHQMLMSYLNGRREGLLVTQSPEQLLMASESSRVQLAASRILVEKPWREQGTGSDIAVMKHAKGWLSQGWQTVMQSLPRNHAMDHHHYLSLEILLRQTLLNGFLLADLFKENRGKFRAPWLDLLAGLDEIKSLIFLKDVLDEVDIEDKATMLSWINEKLSNVVTVMERSRAVAMQAEVYW